mgnify:CR=1 FL=1
MALREQGIDFLPVFKVVVVAAAMRSDPQPSLCYFKKISFWKMATAAEKRDEVKARLQELRNMCRDLHATVMEEGSMPDAADVRATNDKLQELLEFLDPKAAKKS